MSAAGHPQQTQANAGLDSGRPALLTGGGNKDSKDGGGQQILLLLLRLRQCCSHLSLMKEVRLNDNVVHKYFNVWSGYIYLS